MCVNEEGNVVYFIEVDSKEPHNVDKKRVLQLVKMKTLEYKAFHTMHASLNVFLKKVKKGKPIEGQDKLLEKHDFAIKMLLKDNLSYKAALPRNEKFYMDFMNKAVEICHQDDK